MLAGLQASDAQLLVSAMGGGQARFVRRQQFCAVPVARDAAQASLNRLDALDGNDCSRCADADVFVLQTDAVSG